MLSFLSEHHGHAGQHAANKQRRESKDDAAVIAGLWGIGVAAGVGVVTGLIVAAGIGIAGGLDLKFRAAIAVSVNNGQGMLAGGKCGQIGDLQRHDGGAGGGGGCRPRR